MNLASGGLPSSRQRTPFAVAGKGCLCPGQPHHKLPATRMIGSHPRLLARRYALSHPFADSLGFNRSCGSTPVWLILAVHRALLRASVIFSGRRRWCLVFLILRFLVVAHANSSLPMLITAKSDNAQAA